MASPAVVGTPTETPITADSSSWTINRPAGVAGQLTIVCICCDGSIAAVDRTWPAGYTEIWERAQGNAHSAGAYHWENGSEGTSFALTLNVAEQGGAVVYSISGAENPATRAPDVDTDGTVATLNPDPPSLTLPDGSKDYLFIAGIQQNGGEANDDTWCTAAPASYTNLRQVASGANGTAAATLATAERQFTTAGPEDPGTFTVVQSLEYTSWTIAIHPTSTPPSQFEPLRVMASTGA